MKKLTRSLILALAVIMMTQCRKGVDPDYILQDNGGEKITFSLNADGGSSNGTRTDITQDGAALTMKWSAGDVIYVAGSEQAYLGFITLTSGEGTTEASFQGEIKAITEPQDLHLYYLGKNNGVQRTISAENSTTINISSQSGTLDDIENYHIASATVSNVAAGTTDLSATFNSNIAILKFDLAGYAAGTKLYGTNISKTLTLNLKTGTLTGDNSATNYDSGIAISTASAETFLALLPETGVTMTLSDGTKTETYSNKDLAANMFYSDGGDGITTGALSGVFTVNAEGKQVRFSKGNLQYQASKNTWRFAKHQYDCYGTGGGNQTPLTDPVGGLGCRSKQEAWIDLFGWGTSGYNNTANDPNAINYQPWSISNMFLDAATYPNSSTNPYGYGPSNNMTDPNLTGTSASYDWGVYNAISNGGNQSGQWRTLIGGDSGEWYYLCNTRTGSFNGSAVVNASGLYGQGQIDMGSSNYVVGLIILPDAWTTPAGLTFTSGSGAYTRNSYTPAQWALMESAGAVFLPAASFRSGIDITDESNGSYWSSSLTNVVSARNLSFSGGSVAPSVNCSRCSGLSVRLVQDIK